MNNKLDSLGQAFIGGMSYDAERKYLDDAIADVDNMTEPVWSMSGTQGWKDFKSEIDVMLEKEMQNMITAQTMDQLRFSQGMILGLKRIVNYVESTALYFESLQDDKS